MALTRPRAAQIYDIDYKQATRVVTVANITLAGGAPNNVDGVNLSLKDRVLVTGQSTASENGIYYVTTLGTGANGTWTRSADTDATGELLSGTIVMVTEGAVFADTQWKLTTDDPITIGVSALTFVQNYLANSISSGSSNVVVNANANVTVSSNGTANVLVISATGIVVTGTESVTGNATVGNLLTGGLISAAGNITGNGVQFNTSVTPITANVGQAFWDTGEHTVTLGMENGVQQQIGLENYMYVKASAAITNGQAVMFTGASGTNILAAPANTASVGFKSEYIIGVATQDIANNDFGYITVFGLVHGLNTNAWTVGDILWVDNATPGALTNTQPSDPNYQIQMAAVTKKAGGDGHIQVRVTPFFQLDRLRNVQTTSPTTGQALVYDGANSIWINGTAASANTAATVTTNAQPNITSVGTLSSLSATGNIDGNYLNANIYYATGFSASRIYLGNSEVNVTSAGGNVNVSVGGTSNVVVFATTGEYVTGVVSASGNVTGDYINGNIYYATGFSASKIFNGNSEVNVVSAGGNVNVSVGGTSNVLVAATTGMYVTGLQSVTGNITGSNILTGGLISATGNLTSGNVNTGIVSATGQIVTTSAGNLDTGAGQLYLNGASENRIDWNTNGTAAPTYTTRSAGAKAVLYPALGASAADYALGVEAGALWSGIPGNDAGQFFKWYGGNVQVASLSGTGALSASGNITGSNILTGGLISATGTITGNDIVTAGGLSITGNTITASGATIIIDPNGASGVDGNVIIAGNLSVQGNVTYIDSNVITTNEKSITLANNINTGTLADGAGIDVGNNNLAYWRFNNATTSWQSNIGLTPAANATLNLGGATNYWANIYTGNTLIAGTASAAGNITGGNILTGGIVSATGNVTGNYVLGNASQVTGVNTFNQIFVTGATTVNANSLTSNVTFTAGANIELTSDGNIITIAYTSSETGSIFATGGDMGLISQGVTASEDLGDVDTLAATAYDLGTLFSVTTVNQLDVTGFTGNVNAANVNLTGLISAAGNITGAYLFGNGSQITGVTSSATFPLANGTSNINGVSNGNITIGVGGTPNVAVFATTGEYVTGIVSATGNITGGNLSATGNATASNMLTGGIVSATGNITGGNILTGGAISATGNLTLANISPASSNLTISGNVFPSANATYDLGSATARWKTVYTTDLELNNGIGDYTVVEGADDLFLYNNRTGKVFKFALIEVDPAVAPPKAKR